MDDIETKNDESINSNESIESNEDNEQKAKEKLIQRREARMKKILDNAKNRLERLNGRTSTTSDTSTPPSSSSQHQNVKYEHLNGPRHTTNESGEFSDPEIEPDSSMSHHSRPILRDSNAYTSWNEGWGNGMVHQQDMRRDESVPNPSMDMFNQFFAPPPPVKKRHILLRARLHLVLSALISCILAVFWRYNGFSIFIIPGLCVITELLFFREPKTLNPTLLMIFMFLSAPIYSLADKYGHLIAIVNSIIVDLGVFVFSFCTLMSLISICTNNSLNG